MAVLILADRDGAQVSDATAKTVTAARALGSDVHLLVTGAGCAAAAEAGARLAGVTKMLLAESPLYAHALAEPLTELIRGLADGYSHFVFSSSTTAKNVAPRLAALLDVMVLSDVSAVVAPNTFERSVYAGNAVQTVQTADPKVVLTLRTTSFDAAGAQPPCPVEDIPVGADPGISEWVEDKVESSDRPELNSARIVVSGGRGIGSEENFGIIVALADRLGAAVGASRAAVDSGYAPNDWQVGQTGKVVAPELYIAVGISGAIQHLAGMKDSKIIVAINKDEDAPIFQVADYGLVGDLFEIVPQLGEKLGS